MLAPLFEATFPESDGDLLPVLHVLAQEFSTGISQIEAKHASTRRIIHKTSVQVKTPGLDDVSASWVVRNNALNYKMCHCPAEFDLGPLLASKVQSEGLKAEAAAEGAIHFSAFSSPSASQVHQSAPKALQKQQARRKRLPIELPQKGSARPRLEFPKQPPKHVTKPQRAKLAMSRAHALGCGEKSEVKKDRARDAKGTKNTKDGKVQLGSWAWRAFSHDRFGQAKFTKQNARDASKAYKALSPADRMHYEQLGEVAKTRYLRGLKAFPVLKLPQDSRRGSLEEFPEDAAANAAGMDMALPTGLWCEKPIQGQLQKVADACRSDASCHKDAQITTYKALAAFQPAGASRQLANCVLGPLPDARCSHHMFPSPVFGVDVHLPGDIMTQAGSEIAKLVLEFKL